MLGQLTGLLGILFAAAYFLVSAAGGYMVYLDAQKRTSLPFDLTPVWWGLAVLTGGPVLGVVGYWLVHNTDIGRAAEDPGEISNEAPGATSETP